MSFSATVFHYGVSASSDQADFAVVLLTNVCVATFICATAAFVWFVIVPQVIKFSRGKRDPETTVELSEVRLLCVRQISPRLSVVQAQYCTKVHEGWRIRPFNRTRSNISKEGTDKVIWNTRGEDKPLQFNNPLVQ
jgi:hypothetical protein